MASQFANSGGIPLLLGAETILCASSEETQPVRGTIHKTRNSTRDIVWIKATASPGSPQDLALEPVADFGELDARVGDRLADAETPGEPRIRRVGIERLEIG